MPESLHALSIGKRPEVPLPTVLSKLLPVMAMGEPSPRAGTVAPER